MVWIIYRFVRAPIMLEYWDNFQIWQHLCLWYERVPLAGLQPSKNVACFEMIKIKTDKEGSSNKINKNGINTCWLFFLFLLRCIKRHMWIILMIFLQFKIWCEKHLICKLVDGSLKWELPYFFIFIILLILAYIHKKQWFKCFFQMGDPFK